MDCLIGVDIGTTGLKVACYSESGVLLDHAYREYMLSFPREGWVELDPTLWWKLFCECLHEIADRSILSLQQVIGIGVTCTNALILLDNNQHALRPAILQLDRRAAEYAEGIKKEVSEEWIFSKTGNRVSSGAFWGPTLKWIKEEEASLFPRISYFLVPTSYLVLLLSGVYCIDHSRASTTMLYDIHSHQWDNDLCDYFSIAPKALPPIFPSQQVVGKIHGTAARETGLPQGTPIIAGAMDSIGALKGMGVDGENAALIMGTVGRICMETQHLDIRFMNTVNWNNATRHLFMTPVNSAGVSYKWLKQLLYGEQKVEQVYQKMDQIAEQVNPGSDGLLYMPYLSGERAPIWDPYVSGSFLGLTLKHQQKHMIRAVLEGVGFALAQNYEIMKNELNLNPLYLVAGGGGARSRIWMQIISDILGKTIWIPEQLETETFGAAMLTGMGLGLFSQCNWVKIADVIEPNLSHHDHYQKLLRAFKEYYYNNQQWMKTYSSLWRVEK